MRQFRKYIIVFIFLLAIFFVSCRVNTPVDDNNNINNDDNKEEVVDKKVNIEEIIGPNRLKALESFRYEIKPNENIYPCSWTITGIGAKISEFGDTYAVVEAFSLGEVVLVATSNDITLTKTITIDYPDVQIAIIGIDVIEEGQNYIFNYVLSKDILLKPTWSVSDEALASITNTGLFHAKKTGLVEVICALGDNEVRMSVLIKEPDAFRYEANMTMGQYVPLYVNDYVIRNNDYYFKSSNEKVLLIYENYCLAVNIGTATISLYINDTLTSEVVVTVSAAKQKTFDSSIVSEAYLLLQEMTLEEKVGQMMMMGFSAGHPQSDFISAVRDNHIGNVIYMGRNVSDPDPVRSISKEIQDIMMQYNKIPAIISTDQEGGTVARMRTGATYFVSQMCRGAVTDLFQEETTGNLMGNELMYYGINADFAPVMDVNNNPNNPVINIRSYGDNPVIVSIKGTMFLQGMQAANALSTLKHFPGHGNTSTDSHYGLPRIDTPKEELFSVELAPFISGIYYGVDAIMTTHIIFSAIDEEYPATLSKKVLTDLLRNQLLYSGLIITDGMEMGALQNNFGTPSEVAVKAVKAGCDILLYTTVSGAVTAYDAVLSAVKKGDISIDQIDESVLRILETKIKYHMFDYEDILNEWQLNLENGAKHNQSLADKALTRVSGNFDGLSSKDEKVLIISPTTSNFSGYLINSLGYVAQEELKKKGYNNIDYYTVDNKISNSDATKLLERIPNYDTVIIAFSNVQQNNVTSAKNFVNSANKLSSEKTKVVIVSLASPYDYLVYNDCENYFSLYCYQDVTVKAFIKFLNKEIKPKGVSPVKLK